MTKFRKPIIIPLLWAILIIFDNYIDKYFGGIVHFISMCSILVLFIIIVVNIVKELIKIYKDSRSLSFNTFVPLILYVSIPFLCGIIDLDKLDSKVIMRGCYEGTQNQAYILFRQDNSFELNWTGVFFTINGIQGIGKKTGIPLSCNTIGTRLKPLAIN